MHDGQGLQSESVHETRQVKHEMQKSHSTSSKTLVHLNMPAYKRRT